VRQATPQPGEPHADPDALQRLGAMVHELRAARDPLTQPSTSPRGSCQESDSSDSDEDCSILQEILEVISRVVQLSTNQRGDLGDKQSQCQRVMTLAESKARYPGQPQWPLAACWCPGDPYHPDNVKRFQDQWKKGQPVLVAGIDNHLDKDLWFPQSFKSNFGGRSWHSQRKLLRPCQRSLKGL